MAVDVEAQEAQDECREEIQGDMQDIRKTVLGADEHLDFVESCETFADLLANLVQAEDALMEALEAVRAARKYAEDHTPRALVEEWK